MKKPNTEKRIILTGGHARATAYAVIEELKSRHPECSLYFAGSTKVFPGKNVKSLESEMFPKTGVKFLPVFSGRVQRRFTIWTIPEILKIPIGVVQSFYYLLSIRPALLVSFGGFASFPLVFAAKCFGVRILIHEQTAAAGRANLLTARFADAIALSRYESLKYFDKNKCIVTGNPISSGVRKILPKEGCGKVPTVLITGGASGSMTINNAIKPILTDLLKNIEVIHQTGALQYPEFKMMAEKLSDGFKKRYTLFSNVYPWDWPIYLAKADLVISRAGANIVAELVATKRPSILVPLSIAYLDEQSKNASFAKKFGVTTVIKEQDLEPRVLLSEIYRLIKNGHRIYRDLPHKVSPDLHAHKKFVDIIENILAC